MSNDFYIRVYAKGGVSLGTYPDVTREEANKMATDLNKLFEKYDSFKGAYAIVHKKDRSSPSKINMQDEQMNKDGQLGKSYHTIEKQTPFNKERNAICQKAKDFINKLIDIVGDDVIKKNGDVTKLHFQWLLDAYWKNNYLYANPEQQREMEVKFPALKGTAEEYKVLLDRYEKFKHNFAG